MANYRARLNQEPDGSWVAAALSLPHCWSRGATPDAALSRLRDEIRYRIEFCPCSGVDESFVQVQVVNETQVGRSGAASRGAASDNPAVAAPRSRALAAPLSGVAGCPSEPARRASARAARPLAPDETSRAADKTVPERTPGLERTLGWRRWDD